VRPALEAKGLRLETALSAGAGPVSGDTTRLQQVVWNLLSNAVKFTPVDGWVKVELVRERSSAVIRVSDNGQGIGADLLPHVFERFRQGDSSSTRQHGGLGLGLAIARHLVELHGGTVEAHSAGADQGATFTVSLPVLALRPGPAKVERPRTPQPWQAPGRSALTGLRVLVVDDEADAREMLTLVLARTGAEVTAVGSVREALDAMEEWRPNVLVSDVGMPGEDGYALIQRVRGLSPDRGGLVPAVALTAYARAEDRTRILASGFQMHVPKPVDPGELITVVESLASWNVRAG
jgi:CheY-like chemotaxis protein